MIKDIFFYNLCSEGQSLRMIKKVIECDITLEKIKTMSLIEFGEAYGVKKADLFNSLKECALYGDRCVENLSLYALGHYGLSKSVISHIINKGCDKILTFILSPKEYIQNKFDVSNLEYQKVMTAIDDMDIVEDIDFYSLDAKKVIAEVEQDNNYKISLKKKILEIVNLSDKEILIYSEIINKLDSCYKYSNIIFEAIQELALEKKLEFTEFGIKKYGFALLEYIDVLETKDERTKIFIQEYLNGKTYEIIGQENGNISRERVRQIIAKIEFPTFIEDKYYSYFQKYAFDEESFVKVFDVDPKVYRYFDYKSKKRDWVSIDELIESDDITEELRMKLESLNPKFVYIDGKKVYKNMTALLRIFLMENVNEPQKLDDIYDSFKIYWEEITGEVFNRVKRSFKHAVEKMDCTILSNNGWRYYDLMNPELDEFYQDLNLDEFDNKEVNSEIIYRVYNDLMKYYDIRDNYELHCIMKKSGKFSNIDFGRIPILKIGNCDRDDQIRDLLIELSPVLDKDFIKEYKNRYGCHESTLASYVLTNFGQYYNNHMYDVSTTKLTDLEIFKWKKLLDKDFYFHQDVKAIGNDNNLNVESHLFQRINMNEIGFISNSCYIFSNDYASASEYFEKILSEDIVDLTIIDKRILSLVAFSGLLYSKIRNMELFEFVPKKYISMKRLQTIGVSKDDLLMFANKAKKIAKDNVFTIQGLINNGFEDELFDLGFDNLFYSSILVASNEFAFRKIPFININILRTNKVDNKVMISDLLYQEVFNKRYINIYDLLELLQDHFGLYYMDTSKIRKIISETDLYYDDISENIYCDKDTYYDWI